MRTNKCFFQKLIRSFLLLFLTGWSVISYSQEDGGNAWKQQIIELRIEEIASNLEDGVELDYTLLVDDLNQLIESPINLNGDQIVRLRQLYLISEIQYISLENHIDDHGKLLEMYELQAVKGWDVQTIQRIAPFVKVSEYSSLEDLTFKEIFKEGKHDLFLRYQTTLQDQAGYIGQEGEEPKYQGQQLKTYGRYRFKYKDNISIGLTTEKDAGETFLTNGKPDYLSGHIYLKDDGLVKKAVVGDYHVLFGQGLTVWSGLAFGKSAQVMQVRRFSEGIRPYTSVDENRFLRGAATTIGVGNIELTAFYSKKNIDANIVSETDSLTEEEITVSSFQTSGLHRTVGEILDKDAIAEEHYGGNIQFKTRKTQLGLTAIHSEYGANVSRNLSLYNQFAFNSNVHNAIGLNYSRVISNVNFFGETSFSEGGGWATLNGLLAALDKKVSMSIIQRHFSRDYQGIYSNAFGNSSTTANESGVYIGLEYKMNYNWSFSAYSDQFKSSWLRFQIDAPSSGSDYLMQLNYRLNRKSKFYVRYRYRTSKRNEANTEEFVRDVVNREQSNFRLDGIVQVHENVKLKMRAEWTTHQLGGETREHGFMMYQDIVFKKIQSPVSFSVRYALFDTDSYNTRIYAYENDVLYFFSIPAYSGRGSRVYGVMKYKIKKGLDFWVRYGRWLYADRTEIGSGNEAILGNQKSDVRIQLRCRF